MKNLQPTGRAGEGTQTEESDPSLICSEPKGHFLLQQHTTSHLTSRVTFTLMGQAML